MNLFRKYIKLHINFFLILYRSFLLRSDKSTFAFLFNLRSFFVSSPAKLSWDGEHFVVRDKDIQDFEYRIRHQRQCDLAYGHGIKKRAQSLAECYFLNEIPLNDGDIFLDCGANVGDLKIWFDLNNMQVEYIGFEPSPAEYRCLKINVSPSQVHNIGLWKDVGELEFFVSSQGADSSLIMPAHFDLKIKVGVDVLSNYVNSRIRILKLEAEGAEPEILEGLGEKLQMIDYITADLGFERGTRSESTFVPVTNYLLERNFELLNVSHGRVCALYKNRNV